MVKFVTIVVLALAVLALGISHVSSQTTTDDGLRRFEYRYSFKGPKIAGSNGQIPCWNYYGSALASADQLRLTPSIRSRKGSAWGKFIYEKRWWEVEMVFRVTGRGRVGADGLAMWFTEEQGADGPVFGSSDHWKGLGVLFDSFDNDGAQNNPYIFLVPNDGTKTYDHGSDGSSQAIGGCLRDFRNRPYPPRAKLTYYKDELLLYFDQGASPQPHYELCAHAVGVKLPATGYFGLSAATGGLADDHDVLSFKVSSIHSPEEAIKEKDEVKYNPDEYQQYKQDYEKKSEELQQQKETFYKEHPEKRPEELDDWESQYEDPTDQKLRQILEAQGALRDMLMGIRTQVTAAAGAVAAPVPPAGGQPQHQQQQASGSSAALLADLQNKLQTISTEQANSKRLLEELRSRSENAGGGSPGPAGSMEGDIRQLGHNVNVMQGHIAGVVTAVESLKNAVEQAGASSGGSSSGCASTSLFLVASGVQLLIFVVFFFLSNRQKQAQQKKFF